MAILTTYNGQLDTRKARHLLNRITFGYSPKELKRFASMTPSEALAILFTNDNNEPTLPKVPGQTNSWIDSEDALGESEGHERKGYVLSWWQAVMHQTPLSAKEKIAWWLHCHFTTMESRVNHSKALFYQIQFFRHYALGSFKDLSEKMCYDNAMSFHLDGFLNVNGKPNENFAREFLELYTIGKGDQVGDGDYTTYTEADVIEAAKLLSGIKYDTTFSTLDEDTNFPIGKITANGSSATRHDPGVKTFSDKFGNTSIQPNELDGKWATVDATKQEIKDFVDMIFAQRNTALYLCRRIYRFFVHFHIDANIESQVIEPLADIMIENDFVLEPVFKALLSSEHFYDQTSLTETNPINGALIKSPLDISISTLKLFEIDPFKTDPFSTAYYSFYGSQRRAMSTMGLDFYEPEEVAGYPAFHQAPIYHRKWISTSYLLSRYLISNQVLTASDETENLLFNSVTFIENNISTPQHADIIVSELIDWMFPEIITTERYDYFLKTKLLDGFEPYNWTEEWNKYKEGGPADTVQLLLNNLITALLQSPEYQLS